MAIRLHSPLILYSWIHLSAEAILTAVMAYGITKIHSPYKITKTPSTVEACSLSAASFLFMSRRCGRRAGSQWGILHGHVIWALCLDTAHEGQTYLWRAHCETATGKRRRRGGGVPPLNRSFMETACVLRCIYTSMLQSDKNTTMLACKMH